MTLIFGNNTKNLKGRVKNGTGIFGTEKNIYNENLILIGSNGVDLQVIKESQISRHMPFMVKIKGF